MTAPTFDEWLRQGVSLGFCSPVLCETHDGVGLTEEQEAEFNDGGDPCVHVIQVFESEEHRAFVFDNHSPIHYRLTQEMRDDLEHS
jgi:hypothetical protein